MVEAAIEEKKSSIFIPVISIIVGFFIIVSALFFLINLFFYKTTNPLDETKEAFMLKGTNSQYFILVPHVISIIIIVIFLLILMFIINRKIKKADPLAKPKGLLLLVEIMVTSIDHFTIDMLGEKMKSFSPYIGLLAIYLFTANVFGLLGFTPPPTANLTVTLTFGLTTFFLIRYYGIKYQGWGHFGSLFQPILLSPINIIGELAVPFSLSLRLFGNILSGAIIMSLIYGGLGLGFSALFTNVLHIETVGTGTWATVLGNPADILAPLTGFVPLLHIYFDLFAGLIQTFVFILLTSVFISNAAE